MLHSAVTFEGNLAADPDLRFTPAGKPVLECTVLVNRRRQSEAGEWANEEPTRHQVKALETLAQNTAGSAAKGDRIIVAGTITTDTRADKDTGEKRTTQRVLADAIGVSLRWATATADRL